MATNCWSSTTMPPFPGNNVPPRPFPGVLWGLDPVDVAGALLAAAAEPPTPPEGGGRTPILCILVNSSCTLEASSIFFSPNFFFIFPINTFISCCWTNSAGFLSWTTSRSDDALRLSSRLRSSSNLRFCISRAFSCSIASCSAFSACSCSRRWAMISASSSMSKGRAPISHWRCWNLFPSFSATSSVGIPRLLNLLSSSNSSSKFVILPRRFSCSSTIQRRSLSSSSSIIIPRPSIIIILLRYSSSSWSSISNCRSYRSLDDKSDNTIQARVISLNSLEFRFPLLRVAPAPEISVPEELTSYLRARLV